MGVIIIKWQRGKELCIPIACLLGKTTQSVPSACTHVYTDQVPWMGNGTPLSVDFFAKS